MRRDQIRHASQRGHHRNLLTAVALILLAAFLASCAKEERPAYKRIPQKERKEPKDAIRPYEQAPEQPATPARLASDRLVEKGRGYLDAGDLEKAQSALRDAVNVDSANGVAYYWLAIAQARMGEAEVAMGLLDKADALLSRDPEWSERIDQARRDIGVGPSNEVVPSPIDEAF